MNRYQILAVILFLCVALMGPPTGWTKTYSDTQLSKIKARAIAAFQSQHYKRAQDLFDRYSLGYNGSAERLEADMKTVLADLGKNPQSDPAQVKTLKHLVDGWLGLAYNMQFRKVVNDK